MHRCGKRIDLCFRAVNGFTDTDIGRQVSAEISAELDKVFGSENWSEKRFAIRSSAVGEDSSDLSSAGQNETFLGCSGKIRIEEAVRKCWASLFTFQSVEYRRYRMIQLQSFNRIICLWLIFCTGRGTDSLNRLWDILYEFPAVFSKMTLNTGRGHVGVSATLRRYKGDSFVCF